MKTKITKDDVGKWIVVFEQNTWITSISKVGAKNIINPMGFKIKRSDIVFLDNKENTHVFYNSFCKKVLNLRREKEKVAEAWFAEKLQDLKGEGYE